MDRAISFVNEILYFYSPAFAKVVTYMLQATEYNPKEYYSWLLRAFGNYRGVTKRSSLRNTPKAMLLLSVCYVLGVAVLWISTMMILQANYVGVVGVLLYPATYALVLPLLVIIGEHVVQRPKERRMAKQVEQITSSHSAKKIAIIGSYGKTTFKETLATVLNEELHTAASPGNMNTPIGIHRFVSKLDGSEDVIIFELGEGKPGDVDELCRMVKPDIAVITGASEAHLSSFGSIENIVKTLFEVREYVKETAIYKNGESEHLQNWYDSNDPHVYTISGVNGWRVENVQTGLKTTAFIAKRKSKVVWVESQLLGRHQVGPLVAVIDIADSLGMSVTEISEAMRHTKPFEHRMQPRIIHGATVVDDTYNGNSKGVQAGLEWLASVDAKRKIYVTPGLVEQGSKNEEIHKQIGKQIAAAGIDEVVLMKNSVTPYIELGLDMAEFAGHVRIINDPLMYYTNIEQFVRAGDVVLMQNDWTDNYA